MAITLLQQFARPVHTEWERTIKRIIQAATIKNSHSASAATILADYLQNPGKFVRPTLFLTGYAMYAQKKPSAHMFQLAMSFELLHIYLLIQDDIMDQSDIRRGGTSLHKRYEAYHREQQLTGSSSRYGETMAILMSDLISNEAERLWTEAVARHKCPAQIRTYFDILKEEVYWGQYLDVIVASQTELPDLNSIIEVHKKKTGEYTIYRPMQIGALLAGAQEKDMPWLEPTCLNLGIAYQAIDDILGTFGDSHVTGKSTDSDIMERKYTPLVYFAFQAATPQDKVKLKSWYTHQDTGLQPEDIKSIFMHTKSETKTRQLARQYYNKGIKALNQASITDEYKDLIIEFAQFILTRVK